jgi:hypothetical protein
VTRSITVQPQGCPSVSNRLVIPIFFPINPLMARALLIGQTLISTSTPLGSSSFISASMVLLLDEL